MPRGIGPQQKEILMALHRHGGTWRAGGGWNWGSPSTTERLLRSLLPYGLVESAGTTPDRFEAFTITPAGTAKAKTLRRSS